MKAHLLLGVILLLAVLLHGAQAGFIGPLVSMGKSLAKMAIKAAAKAAKDAIKKKLKEERRRKRELERMASLAKRRALEIERRKQQLRLAAGGRPKAAAGLESVPEELDDFDEDIEENIVLYRYLHDKYPYLNVLQGKGFHPKRHDPQRHCHPMDHFHPMAIHDTVLRSE